MSIFVLIDDQEATRAAGKLGPDVIFSQRAMISKVESDFHDRVVGTAYLVQPSKARRSLTSLDVPRGSPMIVDRSGVAAYHQQNKRHKGYLDVYTWPGIEALGLEQLLESFTQHRWHLLVLLAGDRGLLESAIESCWRLRAHLVLITTDRRIPKRVQKAVRTTVPIASCCVTAAIPRKEGAL